MKIIVCGGRYYTDERSIRTFLTAFHAKTPITLLVHGDAIGADKLAGKWGEDNGIEVLPVPAEWKLHDRKAGPLRNKKMLDIGVDQVIAFPGGAGTADMVKQARDRKVPVMEVPARWHKRVGV